MRVWKSSLFNLFAVVRVWKMLCGHVVRVSKLERFLFIEKATTANRCVSKLTQKYCLHSPKLYALKLDLSASAQRRLTSEYV